MTESRPAGWWRASAVLERARWAADSYRDFDLESVRAIARAAAEAGFAQAAEFGQRAVRETGFGVADHKRIKNELASMGTFEAYSGLDLVNPRIDAAKKVVEIPRPAGVVLALAPSTNPVSTTWFKIIISLISRNAVVVSPHPAALHCSLDGAYLLAEAAVRAGAPDGIVQVLEEPTVPLIQALMADERVNVIVATGGTAMVRAAYESGTPAIGVGPGNVPVLVDDTADLAKAAKKILDSKAFDNSVLCAAESVLIAVEAVADELVSHLSRLGGHLCTEEEALRVRNYLFREDGFHREAIGQDAPAVAAAAGLRVPPNTRVLLVPIELICDEDPVAHEKLCPVLGFHRASTTSRGIDAARTLVRYLGRGHSAAIHSRNPAAIAAFGTSVDVLRIIVNSGCAPGVSGLTTNLPVTQTVGTGFAGRSTLGENLGPQHLVNLVQIAYDKDAAEAFDDFADLRLPTRRQTYASLQPERNAPADLEAEIRRIILDELRSVVRGPR